MCFHRSQLNWLNFKEIKYQEGDIKQVLPNDYTWNIFTVPRCHLNYKAAKKNKSASENRQSCRCVCDVHGVASWLDNVSLQYRFIGPVGEVMCDFSRESYLSVLFTVSWNYMSLCKVQEENATKNKFTFGFTYFYWMSFYVSFLAYAQREE